MVASTRPADAGLADLSIAVTDSASVCSQCGSLDWFEQVGGVIKLAFETVNRTIGSSPKRDTHREIDALAAVAFSAVDHQRQIARV